MTDSNSSRFSPLQQFSLIRIEGKDAERFLQGQTSCDVTALIEQQWTLGACCTAKGRMVANFVIARHQQAFWLRLNASQANTLITHLSKYAVFFKADITLLENWQVCGCISESSAQEPAEKTATPVYFPLQSDDHGLQLQWPDGRMEHWQQQFNDTTPADAHWAQHDIEQGLAWVSMESSEQWIPQNIDWHLHGGVSFSKGCYTGQEIIARLQYLGKAKKQLRIITADSTGSEIAIGAHVSDQSGKNRGQIISWEAQSASGLVLIDSNADVDALNIATGQAEAEQICAKTQPLFYTVSQD